MKSIKISRLLFLLAIMAILTACPCRRQHRRLKNQGPVFKKLSIDDKDRKRIIAYFSTDISGISDANRITVKKGLVTLKPTTDYTPTVEDGKLIITLKVATSTGDKYTVKLKAGAVPECQRQDQPCQHLIKGYPHRRHDTGHNRGFPDLQGKLQQSPDPFLQNQRGNRR